MKSKEYRFIEFLILFIIIPIGFCFDFSLIIKALLTVLGFIYVIYVLIYVEKIKPKFKIKERSTLYFKTIVLKFIIIALISSVFVYTYYPDKLFIVLRNKPLMWLILLFVYSIFSVYPQELIYRTFFFNRYRHLISHPFIFILINALIFSLAHLFFKNLLVLLLTFIGGILFASSFLKHRSTLLVSIEHAIYGSWLFTLGLGSIMGFPE